MLLIALGILMFAIVIVFSMRDKLIVRFPMLERPLAFIWRILGYVLYVVFIASLIWLFIKPSPPPPPPVPLPTEIHPPAAFNTGIWTVYNDNSKGGIMSMALPAKKDQNGDVEVWVKEVWIKHDDSFFHKRDNEEVTMLTLTEYDCELGTRLDKYDVFYVNDTYFGYQKSGTEDNGKVELGTNGGSSFLLACFGKMPSK